MNNFIKEYELSGVFVQISNVKEGIGWGDEANGWESALWVGSNGSSEKEDVGFGFVEFVMDPSS